MSKFFIYDGDKVLGEVSSAGVVTAAYTWGADGLVSERLPTASPARSLWYQFGPQGETRALTNSAGAVVDSYSYTAYGKAISASGGDANPFQYGGKYGYYSEYNGAVLCGHRWYDTHDTLRWLSRDPVGYKGGNNLYAYCGGDPVGGIDPSGLDPVPGHGPDNNLLPPGSKTKWHGPDADHPVGHSDVDIPQNPNSIDPRLRGGRTEWRWYPVGDIWAEKKDSLDRRANREEAARKKKEKQDRADRQREEAKERCKEDMDRLRGDYGYGVGGFNPVNPTVPRFPPVKFPEFGGLEPVFVP